MCNTAPVAVDELVVAAAGQVQRGLGDHALMKAVTRTFLHSINWGTPTCFAVVHVRWPEPAG